MNSLEDLLRPVRIVLNEDLETLRRYPVEDRLKMFNMLQEAYKKCIVECADFGLNERIEQHIRGLFFLAQLLLAASFKVNNENFPEITGRFREEEYNIIFDLEELKKIDLLDVDEIVEFIERKEGKVYEIVKKYYDRQYYLLDMPWGRLMGPLALALNERYKRRRKKIEEAVIQYIKKRPLTIFISEIENAIAKALEARREREEAEKLAARFEEELERIEALAEPAAGGESEEELEAVEEALTKARNLKDIVARLEKIRGIIAQKEKELRVLAERYKNAEAAEEVLRAEAAQLRSQLEAVTGKLREYEELVRSLEAERDVLKERLEQLKESIEGRGEGNLVSAAEASALEESLVQRVLRKASDEVWIYDPRRGERVRVVWDKKAFYHAADSGRPRGEGVQLYSTRGVIRKRLDLVLDAATLVHLEAYREKGFDNKPVGLGELLDHLEPRLRRASEDNYYSLIIVSSPTGFTEKAIQYITGGMIPGLAPASATVYLVDPIRGELYYNGDDPAATANKSFAEPWLDEEKIGRALRYLKSQEAMEKAVKNSPVSPFLLSEEVAEATGLDLETVRRAFYELEKSGTGRVVVVEETTAFIFKRIGV